MCTCLLLFHSIIAFDTKLYAETRPPVIWMGKNSYGRVEIWVDGLKNEGAKMSSKTIVMSVMP